MNHLEVELHTFEAQLPLLLKAGAGNYVVIKGSEVAQLLPTFEQALEWAYEHFGFEPFLVKEVQAVEPVIHFSRHVELCAT